MQARVIACQALYYTTNMAATNTSNISPTTQDATCRINFAANGSCLSNLGCLFLI